MQSSLTKSGLSQPTLVRRLTDDFFDQFVIHGLTSELIIRNLLPTDNDCHRSIGVFENEYDLMELIHTWEIILHKSSPCLLSASC
jgi:hypothetical protein